jgi:hypothetical protein
MTDAALQRTVRRCTALVLLQLAVVSAQLYDALGGGGSTITTWTTLPLVVGALGYLFGSLLYTLVDGRGTAAADAA